MEWFFSFSQEFEDLIVFNALHDVNHGFYIDVGANDPWLFSVTKSFYEKGWHGINIEPLKDKYEELCKDRPRDININMGCSNEDGQLDLLIDGMTSSFDPECVKNDSAQSSLVSVKTLAEVCDEYCSNQTIHFLKIDVEGFERQVIQGMDFTRYRPWIIVVEAVDPGTDTPAYYKWEDLLLSQNYVLAFEYGINRYYTDSALPELKQRFIPMQAIFDKYFVKTHVAPITDTSGALKLPNESEQYFGSLIKKIFRLVGKLPIAFVNTVKYRMYMHKNNRQDI